MVWSRYFTSTSENDTYMAQVHWDGTLTTPSTVLDSSLFNDGNPCVSSPMDDPSGAPRPFMVVWERDQGGGTRHLIGDVRINASPVAVADLQTIDTTNAGEDHSAPSIDCDGSMFTVAFAETYQGNFIMKLETTELLPPRRCIVRLTWLSPIRHMLSRSNARGTG